MWPTARRDAACPHSVAGVGRAISLVGSKSADGRAMPRPGYGWGPDRDIRDRPGARLRTRPAHASWSSRLLQYLARPRVPLCSQPVTNRPTRSRISARSTGTAPGSLTAPHWARSPGGALPQHPAGTNGSYVFHFVRCPSRRARDFFRFSRGSNASCTFTRRVRRSRTPSRRATRFSASTLAS
jgi:hypothetical protein